MNNSDPKINFSQYLQTQIENSPLSSDELLIIFLPFMEQVQSGHEINQVAPLDGIQDLHFDFGRIWYEDQLQTPPQLKFKLLNQLQSAQSQSFDLTSYHEETYDLNDGSLSQQELSFSNEPDQIEQPVYLPGFRCWEHACEHHDPLTDIYSLGMIFASLALGVDLSQEAALKSFIRHRKNLFEINPKLHPAFSSIILKMTELNRHKRAQDLPSLIKAIRYYRDQALEKEIDYTQYRGFLQASPTNRRQIIQQYLQKRLFEISRRNRLIYYKESLAQLDLTQASVPTMLDVQNIRTEHLFLWHKELQKKLFSKDGLDLNHYLRFEETRYLPGTLDKIRSAAAKDIREYGFAQLRLVIVFLHWHNLKEEADERIHSPLLLLPVTLSKKKGVKDAYFLKADSTQAELNPALKHHLKELYNLELPDSLDLADVDLNQFHELLQTQIQNSEKAVQLEKIAKPQIEIIYAKAKQRLNSYRKRARISGKGLRSHDNIDYSYDPKNYQPLGLQLFLKKVKNAAIPFGNILDNKTRPRHSHITTPTESTEKSEPILKKEKQLYRHKQDDKNPYNWSFDLCKLTLANFNYRKMSLVQDYNSLLENEMPNQAFDDVFSIEPKPIDTPDSSTPNFHDSHAIVPADRSQMTAVKKSRTGKSYIIQGPPGTGKSQTITNLIADYAARGKRVLFVCEKRAAIDVVYHRLEQAKLKDLCCLIHDSQSDKKAFVMDLKSCYENWTKSSLAENLPQQHKNLADSLQSDFKSLQDFFAHANPQGENNESTPAHQLLESLIELHEHPLELSELEQESLPSFQNWSKANTELKQLRSELLEHNFNGIWQDFPQAQLNPTLAQEENCLSLIQKLTDSLGQKFELITKLKNYFTTQSDLLGSLPQLKQILTICNTLNPLAERKMLDLLNGNSPLGREFRQACKKLSNTQSQLTEARERTLRWTQRLEERDAQAALRQMSHSENSIFRFLSPAFWRLRKILLRSYDFEAHTVKPSYTQVLEELCHEYKLNKDFESLKQDLFNEYGFEDLLQAHDDIKDMRELFTSKLQDWKTFFLKSSQANDFVLLANELDSNNLKENLSTLFGTLQVDNLDQIEQNIHKASECTREDIFLLEQFASLSPEIQTPLKSFKTDLEQLTHAIAKKEFKQLCLQSKSFSRFDSQKLEKIRQRMQSQLKQWRQLNSELIQHSAQEKFLKHLQISNLPAAELSSEQKEFKKTYRAGRKELEHEFSKSMRYKAIRSLSEGATSIVIRDLKPIWLMSPLSVSDTLPLNSQEFDVVIFDEASQIQLEEAIPAVYRSSQIIVVGDEKQLPPTNFFGSKGNPDEESVLIDDVEYDLNADSFLTQSSRNLPSTMLSWHYRSRYEALIAFSNQAFYHGNLLTIPDRSALEKDFTAIEINDAKLDPTPAELSLSRSISFHHLKNGIYQKRRNSDEATYIARHVRELLAEKNGLSIGIVAFSEAQQDQIETALNELGRDDKSFKRQLEAEMEREEDGQHVGLFIKNLENVQGDERDIIILSICYGYDANKKMRMNFGPINKSGGEKRLNVIFSRAKRHMAIISSISGNDITNTYNDGANCLKNYLDYASAVSLADRTEANAVLKRLNLITQEPTSDLTVSHAAQRLAKALRQDGWICDLNTGQSEFRCDIAIRKASDTSYRLGILIDNPAIHQNRQTLEDLVTKPAVLKAFGWQCEYILTKDIYDDFDHTLKQLQIRLEKL